MMDWESAPVTIKGLQQLLRSREIEHRSPDHFYLWGYVCGREARKFMPSSDWKNGCPYYDEYVLGYEDGSGERHGD